LVGVFTQWYRALRLAAAGRYDEADAAYRAAAARLEGAGMPGVREGLLPLASLCLRLVNGTGSASTVAEHVDPGADWGPYRPWVEPFVLLRADRHAEARQALTDLPEPPADLLYEALCCLRIAAAVALDDRAAVRQARDRLRPAAGQLAGAGSGLLTLGPVDAWLTN
jgi:hypothetical protein